MGYKLVSNNGKPKKESFVKEHKETLIVMAVGVIIAAAVLILVPTLSNARTNGNVASAQNEEAVSENPYDEGSGEYYAYQGHAAEVTAIIDMEPLEDGTKSWYAVYLDGWTAWVYLSPDSDEPYIKVESIP